MSKTKKLIPFFLPLAGVPRFFPRRLLTNKPPIPPFIALLGLPSSSKMRRPCKCGKENSSIRENLGNKNLLSNDNNPLDIEFHEIRLVHKDQKNNGLFLIPYNPQVVFHPLYTPYITRGHRVDKSVDMESSLRDTLQGVESG